MHASAEDSLFESGDLRPEQDGDAQARVFLALRDLRDCSSEKNSMHASAENSIFENK